MSFLSPPRLLDGPRWKNMRVGILGGSFNPPHEGHVHISLAALKGLELDAVWWLVSPQNPLKEQSPLPMDERLALCRDMAEGHPKILISDLERTMGTRITYHSVRRIRAAFPGTQFVWISGMDNALGLHRWNFWQGLLSEICMVHLTRSPARSLVRSCPYRMYGRQNHVFIDRGGCLPLDAGTTYWMMQKKMVNISSTDIRSGRKSATKKAVLVGA